MLRLWSVRSPSGCCFLPSPLRLAPSAFWLLARRSSPLVPGALHRGIGLNDVAGHGWPLLWSVGSWPSTRPVGTLLSVIGTGPAAPATVVFTQPWQLSVAQSPGCAAPFSRSAGQPVVHDPAAQEAVSWSTTWPFLSSRLRAVNVPAKPQPAPGLHHPTADQGLRNSSRITDQSSQRNSLPSVRARSLCRQRTIACWPRWASFSSWAWSSRPGGGT